MGWTISSESVPRLCVSPEFLSGQLGRHKHIKVMLRGIIQREINYVRELILLY